MIAKVCDTIGGRIVLYDVIVDVRKRSSFLTCVGGCFGWIFGKFGILGGILAKNGNMKNKTGRLGI
jgi:hypothetical protein